MLRAATAMMNAIAEVDDVRSPFACLRRRKRSRRVCAFQVQLQIGMDCGVVVETILGRRLLPRWKLFGDTVNTASRYAVLR